jgi:chorismate dehydratase
MESFRLGTVPYLNARPLVHGLSEHQSVTLAHPSHLAELLLRGEVQVGLVPAFYLCQKGGVALDVGVLATLGSAESVLLFYRRRLEQVRRLATNAHSLSSNAVARIILREAFGCVPEVITQEADLEAMLRDCDAAVLIGDYAMQRSGDPVPRLDLGAAWTDLTGLPMVWALWVAVDEATAEAARPLLLQAKQAGLAHLAEIAAEHALRSGLPKGRCLRYLSETMRYDYGPREREGLAEFQRRCRELGLC